MIALLFKVRQVTYGTHSDLHINISVDEQRTDILFHDTGMIVDKETGIKASWAGTRGTISVSITADGNPPSWRHVYEDISGSCGGGDLTHEEGLGFLHYLLEDLNRPAT